MTEGQFYVNLLPMFKPKWHKNWKYQAHFIVDEYSKVCNVEKDFVSIMLYEKPLQWSECFRKAMKINGALHFDC